jgi:hypothetical protein
MAELDVAIARAPAFSTTRADAASQTFTSTSGAVPPACICRKASALVDWNTADGDGAGWDAVGWDMVGWDIVGRDIAGEGSDCVMAPFHALPHQR